MTVHPSRRAAPPVRRRAPLLAAPSAGRWPPARLQRRPELRCGAGQGGRPKGYSRATAPSSSCPPTSAATPVDAAAARPSTASRGRWPRTAPARSSSSTSGARGARRASRRRPHLQKAWPTLHGQGKDVAFVGIDIREDAETGAAFLRTKPGDLPLDARRRPAGPADPRAAGQGPGHSYDAGARQAGPDRRPGLGQLHGDDPDRRSWTTSLAEQACGHVGTDGRGRRGGTVTSALPRRSSSRSSPGRLVRLAVRAAARARLPRLRHRACPGRRARSDAASARSRLVLGALLFVLGFTVGLHRRWLRWPRPPAWPCSEHLDAADPRRRACVVIVLAWSSSGSARGRDAADGDTALASPLPGWPGRRCSARSSRSAGRRAPARRSPRSWP